MKDQIMANKWGQDEQNRGIPELDEAGSLEENWQIVDFCCWFIELLGDVEVDPI